MSETQAPVDRKQQLTELMTRYGAVAFGVWWVLFFCVSLPIAFVAYRGGGMSLWASLGIGWAGAQPSKLLRIPATLVLTPIVARLIGREPAEPEAAEETPA